MKKLLTLITAIVMLFVITSCGSSVSDRALRNMLKENGYEYEDCEVKKIYSLSKDLKNFVNDKNNKLVLFEDDDNYGYAVLNTKEKRLVRPRISYIPLDVIQNEIYQNDMNINTRCIEIYKRYIENNGIYCFEDKAIAETYLREITGANGVIPTTTAQNAIINRLSDILPEAASAVAEIIFEKNSAVPMYYAIQGNGGMWTTYDTNMSIVQVFPTKQELNNALKPNNYTMQTGPASNTQTAPVSDDSAAQALYYVRTSFENIDTQKGAFSNLQNARVAADESAAAGYKVYDLYGNIVYTPTITSSYSQPTTQYYYVRNGSKQQGAYKVRQNAINAAEAHKNEGYKVYDESGNLVYAPQVEKEVGTKVINGARFRVRKSVGDSKSQIGAYESLDSAKADAYAHRAEGYKVYDMEGNLIYTP